MSQLLRSLAFLVCANFTLNRLNFLSSFVLVTAFVSASFHLLLAASTSIERKVVKTRFTRSVAAGYYLLDRRRYVAVTLRRDKAVISLVQGRQRSGELVSALASAK